MSGPTTPVNIEDMSDEDFLNMETSQLVEAAGEAPAVEEGNNGAEPVVEQEAEVTTEGETGAETEGEEGQGGGDTTGTEGAEGGAAKAEGQEQQGKEGAEAPAETKGAVPPSGSEAGPKGEEGEVERPNLGNTPPVTEELSDADFRKVILGPIKANGKTIQLKDSKEAIQLIQMGANYTRKMQDIQPHRKVLTMLQNADLLDEGKLDLLIAVSKKDPEAIKRIIKDAGIDPLDIDTTSEPTYVEGSHTISDAEVAFQSVFDDMMSTEDGKATLEHVRNNWDQASKDAAWKEPGLLGLINEQRSNGIYDAISAEVERARMLGQVPADMSFIRAYQVVGEHLNKTGALAALVNKGTTGTQSEQAGQPAPTPVATRTVAPKTKVENDARAKAAAPARVSSKPAKVLVNPLAMSDEEFMNTANFNGRL